MSQSTESPAIRKTSSKAFSSSTVRMSHSSMKFARLIGCWSAALTLLPSLP